LCLVLFGCWATQPNKSSHLLKYESPGVHKHPLTGVVAVDVASVDVAAAVVWGWFIKLKKESKKKYKF